MKSAIIMDLDGSLGNHEHRKHLSTKKDWEEYNALAFQDQPVRGMMELMAGMFWRGHEILVCTGRFERMRQTTNMWLQKYHIHVDHLFMRPNEDMGSDWTVKQRQYDEHIKDKYDVLFVVDDRKSVVDMWRKNGLLVLHCAEGDFLNV
jgi:uncharacterized HAD superfamily protein